MLGGEVSSEQLHGAAQLVFGVLSATGRSPAEKRAELVSSIGFVEQDSFKAATALVAELHQWRESLGGEAHTTPPGHRQAVGEQAPASRRAHEVRKDRAIDWERELDSLPLFDSEGEADDDEDLLSEEGAGMGANGEDSAPVEFLEARLTQHCAGLGLPAEVVVQDVFRLLSSSRGMDEVQSMLR
jgi:hypothetical protein